MRDDARPLGPPGGDRHFGRCGMGTGFFTAILLSSGHAAGGAEPPTFHRDVAPIVFENCSGCHRPSGSAPFPLTSYRDVRLQAGRIVEVVESGFMPPWLPERGFGDFSDERRLTEDEIAILREWHASGAPEGEPDEARPAPVAETIWELGEPDLVVEMPRAYTLSSAGGDVYRNFAIGIPIDGPRFIRAVELHPGSPKIVHHARILVDRTGASRRLEARDPEPGYDGMLVDGGEFPDGVFLGWAPGKVPRELGEAFVWRAEPGMDLVLQLHMLPSGEPEAIQAKLGLYFTEDPPRRRAAVLQLGSRTIDIPAGEADHVVDDHYVLPADVEVLGIYPHAHHICRVMEAYATHPDGRQTWLLKIEEWDFYWQDEYRYRAPVFLPEGTSITMRYVYDNSAANLRNPFSPPRRVRFGPRSEDEMGDLLLMVVPRAPGDLARLRADALRHELLVERAGLEKRLETDPENADVRNELAFVYLELGRREEAVREWSEAVRIRPDFAEAQYNLGAALAAEGRRKEALRAFEKAIASEPDRAEAHNNLGVLLQAEGRTRSALASYRRALEIRPGYAFAHGNLGSALLASGEIEEAIRHLEEAVRLDPENAQAQYALGSALGRLGRLEEEVGRYRLALEAKPDYPEALNNLGGVLTALGRGDEAVAPLREAIGLRPDYALGHLNLAKALAATKAFDEAAASYRKALALRPGDAGAHLGLGAVLLEAGKLGEALNHYRIAARLAPGDFEPWRGLAWILAIHSSAELRDPEKSIEYAERAAKLARGDDARTLDTLGAAYAAAGRFDEAVSTAETARVKAASRGLSELEREIASRVDLYRSRRPYRAPR